MQDDEKQLEHHEIGEFVSPMIKVFHESFVARKEGMLAIDLIHITSSVVTSLIASCMECEDPINNPKFKMVLAEVIQALVDVHDGKLNPEYMGRMM